MFPLKYHEPVFRPPSEAHSFLLQVTIGCSNNKCTYCDMYRSKQYRERSFDEIKKDILDSYHYFKEIHYSPKRIFLCDGDALGAKTELLVKVLELLNKLYPNLERVGIYATAQNMLEKSDKELALLFKLKLSMVYLGLESGSDEVLHRIVKGNKAHEMITGSKKIMNSGMKLSVIAMLGIGGEKYSETHIVETAKVLSEISPHYLSFLTTMAIKGTPFYRMVERGTLKELTSRKMFYEMREILDRIQANKNIVFRANHISNQYPLGGTLPEDQGQLVKTIEAWMLETPVDVYPPKPSTM
ncbi:MAG: radical SAM protein [Halobacteriovoraceae bacterium]|jgi:radical SAM superfamily enzyme YgiQ (UPF0313 family)|nr:radical SAM protein [Halobacteriovoraceae bacterium]|tara:strand:- start:98 stop:994 length:897 start_codon:yes stop_codon:yes gene_type:complete